MKVSEALATRMTCRAFTDAQVSEATVRAILSGASRAPSGGNLQPWRVWAAARPVLAQLKTKVRDALAGGAFGEVPTEYSIYPDALAEPYASRRFRAGEMMYDALGVPREDRGLRMQEMARNFEVFGAPAAFFFAIDRSMQQGQWAELGMFMQSLMLLAREHGLHTAPIAAWALWHRTVRAHFAIPDELMFYCGMGLGEMDLTAPVNQLRTERAPVDEFATLVGF